MFKWIFRLAVVVVLLLVVGVVGLYLGLDSIVKKTIEVAGTNELKVTTKLDSVSLGLMAGSIELKGFSLGSPEGFKAPQMMSVGDMKVNAGGVSRLRNNPIHLSVISVDGPVLVVENKGREMNYKALMKNLPSQPDKTPSAGAPADQKRYVIDSLSVTNAVVQLDVNLPAIGAKQYKVDLPAFEMKNLGNEDGQGKGVAMKDVVTAVLTKMVADATQKAGLPPELTTLMNGNLGDVKDRLTGAAQSQLNDLGLAPVGNLLNGLTGKPAVPGQPAANPVQGVEDQLKNKIPAGIPGLGK